MSGQKYVTREANHSKVAYSVLYACTPFGILPPMVVYKAAGLWRQWMKDGPKHTRYAFSKTGWFTTELVEARKILILFL